jgi:hypothetical protein
MRRRGGAIKDKLKAAGLMRESGLARLLAANAAPGAIVIGSGARSAVGRLVLDESRFNSRHSDQKISSSDEACAASGKTC